jgi:hypothetical protein
MSCVRLTISTAVAELLTLPSQSERARSLAKVLSIEWFIERKWHDVRHRARVNERNVGLRRRLAFHFAVRTGSTGRRLRTSMPPTRVGQSTLMHKAGGHGCRFARLRQNPAIVMS